MKSNKGLIIWRIK